jgi:Transposase and inactivated derivatives
MGIRKRTPSEYICYGLYLYFSGLSLRRASERLSYLIKRNHVSIWNWIQRYKPEKIASKRKKVEAYIIDETIIKVGSNYIWLWTAIEPTKKEILGISISLERNMFVAERKFISKLCKIHGKHPISTDGGTWYQPACKFLNIIHHLHSSYEKSIIERTMQYVKDRTESFDDYFPCRKKKCKLK